MKITIDVQWQGRFTYKVTSDDLKADQETSDDLSSTIRYVRRLICRARSLMRPLTQEGQKAIMEQAS